jgi:hypothetical protein
MGAVRPQGNVSTSLAWEPPWFSTERSLTAQ